jgi:tocopherol O-methyltransferase
MDAIRTDRPIALDRLKITREIADFWNKTSRAWQTIWGPHIHHGYFESHGETPVEAQEKLIEKLLELLEISPADEILDVGCGMGGSSLYLAKKYGATVTGITLSPKQVQMARQLAREGGMDNVRFMVEDALSMSSLPDASFDLVWSLESCEQFYDKQMFIQQAFRVLKPGGRLMLATWCSGADQYEGLQARQYRKLCVALQLPYMPTINRYAKLLQQQGFGVSQKLDWSANVKETWTVGLASLRSYSFLDVLRMSGWRGLLFARQGRLMQDAFDQGRITYGVFLATKP